MSDELNGVADILRHLAEMARGYDNHLKWNEAATLKADLMNTRRRWMGVSVEPLRPKAARLACVTKISA